MTSFFSGLKHVDDRTKDLVYGWIRTKKNQLKLRVEIPIMLQSISIMYLYQRAAFNQNSQDYWRHGENYTEMDDYEIVGDNKATQKNNMCASRIESLLYSSHCFKPKDYVFNARWTVQFNKLMV